MNVKDPSSRLMRCRLRLEEFDYTINYKKGTLNQNADALSRRIHQLTQDEPEAWDDHVPQVQYIFNTMKNRSIGMTPLKASSNKDHLLI